MQPVTSKKLPGARSRMWIPIVALALTVTAAALILWLLRPAPRPGPTAGEPAGGHRVYHNRSLLRRPAASAPGETATPTIHGNVYNGDGRVLEGATVVATTFDCAGNVPAPVRTTKTDAAGRFELPVASGHLPAQREPRGLRADVDHRPERRHHQHGPAQERSPPGARERRARAASPALHHRYRLGGPRRRAGASAGVVPDLRQRRRRLSRRSGARVAGDRARLRGRSRAQPLGARRRERRSHPRRRPHPHRRLHPHGDGPGQEGEPAPRRPRQRRGAHHRRLGVRSLAADRHAGAERRRRELHHRARSAGDPGGARLRRGLRGEHDHGRGRGLRQARAGQAHPVRGGQHQRRGPQRRRQAARGRQARAHRPRHRLRRHQQRRAGALPLRRHPARRRADRGGARGTARHAVRRRQGRRDHQPGHGPLRRRQRRAARAGDRR